MFGLIVKNVLNRHVVGIITREWIEIWIQFYALMLFGGIDFHNSNVLAQEVNIVESFCVIVGLNAIVAGILLIMYTLRHDTINGNVFIAIYFTVDAIFEFIYVLFPLLYLTSDDTNSIFSLKSLGLLKQQNSFFLVQSLFAIILLGRKCWRLLYSLDPNYIAKSFFQKLNSNTVVQRPWVCVV